MSSEPSECCSASRLASYARCRWLRRQNRGGRPGPSEISKEAPHHAQRRFVTETKLLPDTVDHMELAGVLISTTTERFAAMRSFWVDTLGLTPRSDRPGFVNFELGSARITIALHDAVVGSSVEPERLMVNLAVDDIDAWVARCDDVVRPPEREKWGGLVATVRDPDGNYIQFLQME